MNTTLRENYWRNDTHILGTVKALSFLAFAIIVNYYAVRYATTHAGPIIPDLLFEHLPRVDTHLIDYYFAFYFAIGTFLFSLSQPRSLLFFLKTIACLILTRDFFMVLTHLGIPTEQPTLSFFTQGGDLFFSGHTALPFMAALVFWDIRIARYIFLFLTIFMGGEVLFARQHYSIDVFAAPFITYGVYVFCQRIFKNDYDSIGTNEAKSTHT